MTANEDLDRDQARQTLLREGTRAYLDAVTALLEFQKEVHQRTNAILLQNINEYAAAMAIPLPREKIETKVWPSLTRWEGDWWRLGVQMEPKNVAGLEWWYTSCGLGRDTDARAYCWVSAWFPMKAQTKRVFERFQRLSPTAELTTSRRGITLTRYLVDGEEASFDEKLDELFEEWIRIWKEIGGLECAIKA